MTHIRQKLEGAARPFVHRGLALLAAAALLLFAAVFPTAALADPVGTWIAAGSEPLTPGTACGVPGVGKVRGAPAEGNWFKGYLADSSSNLDEKYNPIFGTAAVDTEGYWFWCAPWIKPGQMPNTPQPDSTPCGGSQAAIPTWTGSTGVTCKGDRPSLGARAGGIEVYRSGELGKVGSATFACVAGKMQLQPGADCFALPECAGRLESQWGPGNACKASAVGFFAAGTVIPLTTAPGAAWRGTAGAWCNPKTMALEWNPAIEAKCQQAK